MDMPDPNDDPVDETDTDTNADTPSEPSGTDSPFGGGSHKNPDTAG